MNLLLDTHIFLWLMNEPERLSANATAACSDPANQVHLSITSLWEIQIKKQLGKLKLSLPLAEIVREQTKDGKMLLLPTLLPHVLGLEDLPLHHGDPFDRMLLSQAKSEKMRFVTADEPMRAYSRLVELLW